MMDIFVLTTHHEGLPLVILEAMDNNNPVIATDVDGVPEIVIHNETGLLFPHEDDAVLSKQILSLVRDRTLAIRLAEAGRESVATAWTAQRFAKDVADLYRRMLPGAVGRANQAKSNYTTETERSSANHGI